MAVGQVGDHNFIGRKAELERLQHLLSLRRSSIVVIKGRRRIGKSRLASEFAKQNNCRLLTFTGLAPADQVTAQHQLDNFAHQLHMQVGVPFSSFTDWNYAFNALSSYISDQHTVILLDEISWLGDQDPTFVGKLKAWWDLTLSQRNNITLVLCGSVSIWIEENIINSTALFGRISLILTLEPLSLQESYTLLRLRGYKGSMYDVYKILAVTGGVPWYLEHISTQTMANENIKRLCFSPGGIFISEFKQIVNDLFKTKSLYYKKILESLKDGALTLHDVRKAVGYGNSGTISMYMDHLVISGFVKKYSQWSLKTGKRGKQSLYSLVDPYVRFYIKYIEPRLEQIEANKFAEFDISTLPGFDTIIGLQLESLLLQNRAVIFKLLGINPVDCLHDNPYIQHATVRKKGCQIDYLIQTRNKNLYVCEFKFKMREIPYGIIAEMQDRIDRLSVPHNYGIVPVLFHISGVADSVLEQDYFFRVIDLGTLLEPRVECEQVVA
ncbi:MAG TPA: ATP-binding protein [Gammaproteobacteria bacterium]|nr:ATP-binding protein [Gammaproteobacteria bacterium]